MSSIRVSDYIARAAVLSEILSLFQALINAAGGSLSYVNLVSFFVLSISVLIKLKLSPLEMLCIGLFLFLGLLKIFFQGTGDYFYKAYFLILLMPIYFSLAKRTSFESLVDACRRYRYFIIFAGISYMTAWAVWGEYRNASTVTAFLMLYLGYKNFLQGIVAAFFALVMKTQYQIWVISLLFISPVKNRMMKTFITSSALASAALLPLILALIDLSWLVIFNPSQMASLAERLSEVKAFVQLLSANLEFVFFGWPIGQAVGIEGLSERGYMHSAYLWLIGTFGIFISVIMMFVFIKWQSESRKCFLIKVFLILSNALTFLLFTNPFCTIVLLSRERKLSF